MRRLFVDTSAYFALADKRDENHEAAVHFIGYATAFQVLQDLYKSQTRIFRVREAEERKALEIIRTYTDKEFSLVDAISFATMERFHLTQAFAFDHHFAQYGLALLPA